MGFCVAKAAIHQTMVLALAQVVEPASVRKNGLMKGERIGRQPEDKDMWLCLCGNHLEQSGFYPCLEDGTESSDPVRGRREFACCVDCGRIIDAKTLEVVGIAQVG